MKRTILMTASAIALATVLSGCVTDTVATTTGNLVTDVTGLITQTNVLTKEQIAAIQDKASLVCKFVPTVTAITNIASTFSTTVATGSALVVPIVDDICNAVNASEKASPAALSVARRFGVEKTEIVPPKTDTVVGQVNGVSVEGFFVR